MSDVKLRGAHRATATKLLTKLGDLTQSTVIEEIKVKAAVAELRRHREEIISYDKKIQTSLEDEELLNDMEESSRRILLIEEGLALAEDRLVRINSDRSQIMNSTRNEIGIAGKSIKLPTINLPKFNGNPLDWSHFWDIFNNAINIRTDISDAQKFAYLTGQLKDEAADLLEGLTTSDASYIEAVHLLKETYGDPKRIIQSHLHALFDLKGPSVNTADLSKFRSTFECHLRGLKALGTNVDEAGFVLAALLLRKLPNRIKDNINRAARSNYWTLEDFRKAINDEITLLQAVEPETHPPNPNTSKLTSRGKRNFKPTYSEHKVKSTVSNFNVSTNERSKENQSKLICRLCFKDHHVKNCEIYKVPLERVERSKELNLCQKCLTNTHSTSKCFSNMRCKFCQGQHNTELCLKKTPQKESENVVSATTSCRSNGGVALPTAVVKLQGPTESRAVRTLFDQGSQRTFIHKDLVDVLGLRSKGSIILSIDGFNNKGKIQSYKLVEFTLITRKSIIITAVVVDSLPSTIYTPGLSKAVKELTRLNIRLADPVIDEDVVSDIFLMIGSDYYFDIVEGYGTHNKITIIYSLVGNMIAGKLPQIQKSEANSNSVGTFLTIGETPSSLDKMLEKFWTLDSVGITPHESSSKENEAYEKFKKELKFEDGHYVASLPWKKQTNPLPTNFHIAKYRLFSTIKQLTKNNLLQTYHYLILEQLEKGFTERVEDLYSSDTYYIPHFPVVRDSATTPIRIVYDCSSGTPSLNDCLLTGPALTNDLCKILLRFRTFRYVCMSDIEKAFLNIHLNKKDRNYTRFLWLKDPTDLNSPLVVYRFKVVLFGATCSPFLLNASIKHHLENLDSTLSKDILNGLYVDNVVYSSNVEEDLIVFYKEAKTLMTKAGLTLREWNSNSESLKRVIKENDGVVNILECNETKVFGLLWNPTLDTIMYSKHRINPTASTKRGILQTFASVFDPLGYLLPVTISARIFMQNLWKLKMGWDDSLSSQLIGEWQSIASNINLALKSSFPRKIISNHKIILHAFSDAGGRAYGASIYAVCEEVSLVMAKAKVAPIKTVTIPQLELTASVLAARLMRFVMDTFEKFNIEAIYFLTDSQVVLSWMKSNRILKPYVQNRLDEIRKYFPNQEWQYVPTKENPSDLLTRATTAKNTTSELWLRGPKWLKNRSEWPKSGSFVETALLTVTPREDKPTTQQLFSIEGKRLFTVLKITALVIRFIARLKKQDYPISSMGKNPCHNISVPELQRAELYWVNKVQLDELGEHVTCLKQSRPPTNLIKQLNLFLDNEGLLRCRKRLDYSHLNYDVKYPILLPNNHPYTKLLIRDYHSKNHCGVSQMISMIRQKWWFPKMRQTIKSAVFPCVICKKIIGNHYKSPPTPPLPKDRLTEAEPFTITGIDYTGALQVKEGRKMKKTYILLFTCATTRAIHLELVDDMTSETFVRALRRFICRRTTPSCIYCDNAPTFVKLSNLMKKMYDQNTKAFLLQNRIDWKFIPSRAPWFGGFWERMIQLTKTSLKKILGNALVNRDELSTVLVEIEKSLNNRPLTYTSDDPLDLNPLTPSNLLYGIQPGMQDKKEITNVDNIIEHNFFSRRLKYCNKLKEHFWTRWRNEYVTALRDHYYKSRGLEPKIGDIVQIKEDLPRARWRLGKILTLFKGKDGHARSAEVETTTGKTIRPIVKLYPLEIRLQNVTASSDVTPIKRALGQSSPLGDN